MTAWGYLFQNKIASRPWNRNRNPPSGLSRNGPLQIRVLFQSQSILMSSGQYGRESVCLLVLHTANNQNQIILWIYPRLGCIFFFPCVWIQLISEMKTIWSKLFLLACTFTRQCRSLASAGSKSSTLQDHLVNRIKVKMNFFLSFSRNLYASFASLLSKQQHWIISKTICFCW